MPSDAFPDESPSALDVGLLAPVAVGHDAEVTDAAVLDALVAAEVALVRAYADVDAAPASVADAVESALGWVGPGQPCRRHGVDAAVLAEASVSGGNPVIPLVAMLKERVPADTRTWMHRGATSQDILDSALMLTAHRAATHVAAALRATERALTAFAEEHRDTVAAARTLTQHAVPTTVGLRAATWLRGVRRSADRLVPVIAELPAQLGGAGGTMASFVEVAGSDAAGRLPERFAASLGLAAPEAPWHTTRWPVTELGDALTAAIDAVGVIAADVATLSRTEIGELAEGVGGGSSAMPQKQNPAGAVLIRSAALRAPQLAATLHLAAATAVDERPDGAWHAEWPTLRELLRLALGATAQAARLVEGLTVDREAVARNLALTRGLIVAERLSLVLGPRIGRDRLAALIAAAGADAAADAAGDDLAALVRALPEAADLDVDALLEPANYTGLAARFVDDAVGADRIPHPGIRQPARPEDTA